MQLLDQSDSEDEAEFDEKMLLKYYFTRGFSYNEIILFLAKHHNYEISYSTLLRRLKKYGLKRRNASLQQQITIVQRRIREILDGPGSRGGYRSIWHTLELEGIRVPRIIVQELLKEMDPDGVAERKARRLKRRVYSNPGPNYSWHQDGYDKLKPWGFPIHGCIDGFSRKILWLNVTRSNNLPENPAKYYLTIVNEFGGAPVQLVTDLGTENGLVAAMQCYFRDNPEAHRYVPSPRNQRIEGWWSFFCKNRADWWRTFFKDLESQNIIDLASEMCKECLWFCFSGMLQAECDKVKEHWNTHYIRKSRHETLKGRPDSLFFLPEHHGGTDNLLLKVSKGEIDFISQQCVCVHTVEDNIYQEYFSYVCNSLGLTQQNVSWQSALELYKQLLNIAENGHAD